MFTNSWNRWQNGRTVIVWLRDIFVPKFKWSRHHPVSFFAVKCRKNGYFHTFLSRKCFKTALKGSKGSNTNRLALEQILTKNRVKPLSFNVIFCRKCRQNGYFHTRLGHSCFKATVIGGKGSNTNGLALGHTIAKYLVEPSSFSVIFCRKMP